MSGAGLPFPAPAESPFLFSASSAWLWEMRVVAWAPLLRHGIGKGVPTLFLVPCPCPQLHGCPASGPGSPVLSQPGHRCQHSGSLPPVTEVSGLVTKSKVSRGQRACECFFCCSQSPLFWTRLLPGTWHR